MTRPQQKRPDADSPYVSTGQIMKQHGVSRDVAATLTAKIKPAFSTPFGRGEMLFYNRADVQPVIDKYLAKVGVKEKLPSETSTTTGVEAKLVVMSNNMLDMQQRVADSEQRLIIKMTEQNKTLFAALDKLCSKVDVLLNQLGVKS